MMRPMLARMVVLLVAGGGAAGILAAPGAPARTATPEYRTVDSSVLVCPALSVTDDTAGLLTGLVAASPDDPSRPVGVAPAGSAEGAAALRTLGADLDLARIAEPGAPLSLLVSGRSQPPILMASSGAFAPAAVAGVASLEREGPGAGLASSVCPPPGAEWWFVGAGSQLGRGSALLVANAAQEPARFDISLYARSGPVAALAGKGITLGPQSRVRLRLDALAQGEDLLAVQLRATSGRIAAALRDVSVPRGQASRGVDFIPAAIAPTTRIHIAGIPGGEGSRDLVMVNPGTQFATLSVRLLTADGPEELSGLATLAVPAGSVVSVPVDAILGGRGGTLDLTSDVPVTAGLRSDWGGARRDTSWLSATPAVQAPDLLAAAAVVPAGDGLGTTVAVAAVDGPVSGTLQVLTAGSSADSLLEAAAAVASGEADDASPSGLSLITAQSAAQPSIRVSVPAGSQGTVDLPSVAGVGLVHLSWTSDPESGPALLSHLTLDPQRPLATGYSWWPTASAALVLPAREDLGTLLP